LIGPNPLTLSGHAAQVTADLNVSLPIEDSMVATVCATSSCALCRCVTKIGEIEGSDRRFGFANTSKKRVCFRP
jgi:uncharacterized protein YsxB (DUF464 family)